MQRPRLQLMVSVGGEKKLTSTAKPPAVVAVVSSIIPILLGRAYRETEESDAN
jgi:hypothetical protein